MKQNLMLPGFLLLLLLLILTGCSGNEADSTEGEPTAAAALTPTNAPQAAETTAPTQTAVPTGTIAPTMTAHPTATATELATATPEMIASNCLSCHSDKDTLIAVAAPFIEPEEGESSGVG